MISLHSHSGQYCCHAHGTLDQVIAKVIEQKYKVFGMSEHMPRSRPQDLYQDEWQGHSQEAHVSNWYPSDFSEFNSQSYVCKSFGSINFMLVELILDAPFAVIIKVKYL